MLDSFNLPPHVYPFIPIKTQHNGLIFPSSVGPMQGRLFGLWGFQLNFLKANKAQFNIVKAAKYSHNSNNAMKNYVERLYPMKS